MALRAEGIFRERASSVRIAAPACDAISCLAPLRGAPARIGMIAARVQNTRGQEQQKRSHANIGSKSLELRRLQVELRAGHE